LTIFPLTGISKFKTILSVTAITQCRVVISKVVTALWRCQVLFTRFAHSWQLFAWQAIRQL